MTSTAPGDNHLRPGTLPCVPDGALVPPVTRRAASSAFGLSVSAGCAEPARGELPVRGGGETGLTPDASTHAGERGTDGGSHRGEHHRQAARGQPVPYREPGVLCL